MTDEDRTGGPEDAPEGRGATDEGTVDEDLGLEARLARLDRIVSLLESDDVDLDRALALFEEGVAHVRAAEKALSEAELRVEELLGEGPEREVRELERKEP